MTAAFPVRGTLLGSLLVILASGAQIESNVFAATIEAPLTGPTTTINFNSLSVTGSTPAGTVNVGGDAFSATSPSEAFILAGYSATGNNQIFSTDNGSSFTTPDSLTIAPAAGVTEIGLTYGTFNLFGVGAFTPLTISATVNTVSGSPTSFVLPNPTTGVEEVVDFVSTSAITSIVLSGLAPQRPFAQSTEIDLVSVTQNTVTATPLPGALALFGTGLFGLLGFAGLRRAQGQLRS